jgi:ribosomal protein L7/L12
VAPQPAAPRPAAPQPAPPPEAEALASPRYDVSVAKVRGPKQDTLVQLLVERLGLSPEEAQKQVDRTIVMVCKGGSATEADDWRRTLEEIGLKPHIRKR